MPYCVSLSITVTRVILRTPPDLQPIVDFLQLASDLKAPQNLSLFKC